MKIHCFGNSHLWALLGHDGRSDERITFSEGDLELIGWKLGSSGATAYGLLKKGSQTGAGEKIPALLDKEPGKKDILLVFGEVDVSDHIGRHGGSEDDELRATVDRYFQYIDMLRTREDIGLVLVASMVPHSHLFRRDDHARIKMLCEKWNLAVEAACDERLLSYVDWYTPIDIFGGSPADGEAPDPLEKDPNNPEERHLAMGAQPVLLESLRVALLRDEE